MIQQFAKGWGETHPEAQSTARWYLGAPCPRLPPADPPGRPAGAAASATDTSSLTAEPWVIKIISDPKSPAPRCAQADGGTASALGMDPTRTEGAEA